MCGGESGTSDVWEAISGCAVPLNPGVRYPGVSSNRCIRWVVVSVILRFFLGAR